MQEPTLFDYHLVLCQGLQLAWLRLEAAAGIVLVVDKAIDILKELPVPAGGANLTTVPLLPMPSELMGKPATVKTEAVEPASDLPGDHYEPRAAGGSNSNSNLRVVSKKRNGQDGAKPKE